MPGNTKKDMTKSCHKKDPGGMDALRGLSAPGSAGYILNIKIHFVQFTVTYSPSSNMDCKISITSLKGGVYSSGIFSIAFLIAFIINRTNPPNCLLVMPISSTLSTSVHNYSLCSGYIIAEDFVSVKYTYTQN